MSTIAYGPSCPSLESESPRLIGCSPFYSPSRCSLACETVSKHHAKRPLLRYHSRLSLSIICSGSPLSFALSSSVVTSGAASFCQLSFPIHLWPSPNNMNKYDFLISVLKRIQRTDFQKEVSRFELFVLYLHISHHMQNCGHDETICTVTTMLAQLEAQ
ncbi:hypothetical protein L596_026712 [Steinernema carpocapsae]|uniref:Uncharacterized protein n=1 Tax=Steinernema carpocapsae TaxID=34508 RepID=A0A4V5ZY91_STECR|nr:hypothetical protein L596_026712 [Steinernema carpocapsae]